MNIDWALLGPQADISGAFQQGFATGEATKRKRAQESALAGYFAGDKSAVQRLGAVDPGAALSLMRADRETADYEREGQARNALGDFFAARNRKGPPSPALAAPVAGSVLAGVAPSTLPPATSELAGFGPLQARSLVSPTDGRMLIGGTPGDGAQGMPSMQGAALGGAAMDDDEDEALMRLARANPEAAFKVQTEGLRTDKARFEVAEARLDVIGRLAGSAVDQASYTAALRRGAAMGVDVSSLPEQFDAAAVRSIQLQALDGKEQLAAARADRQLNWNMEDDELDNARDDRNVTSQVETREGQLANTRRGQDISAGTAERGQNLSDARGRRGQDLSDARGRRGQDLSDGRGRRGQDVSDARGRRGQDMADKRGRESASFNGTGGRGRRTGGGTSAARIVNPATGKAMVLRDGKWVPES